jgi:hypothetical protein
MSAQEQLPNSDARSEDWDRSEIELDPSVNQQNSVAFPGQDGSSELHDAHPPHEGAAGKRTLSELLKIYAEKGTDVSLNPEEASRVADVLKAWVCDIPFIVLCTQVTHECVGSDKLRLIPLRRRR